MIKYDRSEKYSFTASIKTLKTLSHSGSKVLFLLVLSPLFLLQTLNCFPHPFSLSSLYVFFTMLLTIFFSLSNKDWTREDIKWRQWWCYQLDSSSAFLSPVAYLERRWVRVERCKKRMLSWDVSLMLNTWPGAGLVCRLLA